MYGSKLLYSSFYQLSQIYKFRLLNSIKQMLRSNIQTTVSKRSKTNSINEKLLSQYVFPINQIFQLNKPKLKVEKNIEKNYFKTVYPKNEDNPSFPLTSRSYHQQNKFLFETVSQYEGKNQKLFIENKNQKKQSLNKTFYGLYPQRLINKNNNLYKKRFNSIDISNVDQFHVTSYKTFSKPKSFVSSVNSRKNKSKNKELIIDFSTENRPALSLMIQSEKTPNIMTNQIKDLNYKTINTIRNNKLSKFQQKQIPSTLLRKKLQTRINWNNSSKNLQDLPLFSDKQIATDLGLNNLNVRKVKRKCSISPWENSQNNDNMSTAIDSFGEQE